MKEIYQKITDSDISVHVVSLLNGEPKHQAIPLAEMLEEKKREGEEIVGVFVDGRIALELFNDLKSGDVVFLPE